MPVDPKKLYALVGPVPSAGTVQPVNIGGLPQAWGVTYAHPNPDGSRKQCQNCILWVRSNGGRCYIHAPSVQVAPDAVCGYHVNGQPNEMWIDHPGIQFVDPKTSGLQRVIGGTSCDRCKFYGATSESGGLCFAVVDKVGTPAQVEALGCCSRWEALEMLIPEEGEVSSGSAQP